MKQIDMKMIDDNRVCSQICLEPGAVARPTRVCLLDLFCSGVRFYVLLGPCLCLVSFLCLNLYVFRNGALMGCGVFHANQTSMCLDPNLN